MMPWRAQAANLKVVKAHNVLCAQSQTDKSTLVGKSMSKGLLIVLLFTPQIAVT